MHGVELVHKKFYIVTKDFLALSAKAASELNIHRHSTRTNQEQTCLSLSLKGNFFIYPSLLPVEGKSAFCDLVPALPFVFFFYYINSCKCKTDVLVMEA